MQDTGLTTFAAVFMFVSMGSVTILMVWCFYRILAEPGQARPPEGDSGAGTSVAPGGRS